MRLHNPTADIFIPDARSPEEAFARITHLGVGAHQDDLEFMAFHGIAECFRQANRWFGGVTCTNGSGSPRSGRYASYSDDQMQAVRRDEQKAAAVVGRYGVMAQLDYPSKIVKDPADPSLTDDLKQILSAMRPQVIYTHNLADKHDTHVAVARALLRALRGLPATQPPPALYGCEVWRDLDWLPDREKIVLDVSGAGHLAAALNGVFDSQIAGGKRYDLATQGRRRAHATFFESHATDKSTEVIFAMDLTPLVADRALDEAAYVRGLIDRFQTEVTAKLAGRGK